MHATIKKILAKVSQKVHAQDSTQIYSFSILFMAILVTLGQQSWVRGLFMDGYLYVAFGRNALEKGHWIIPHLSENLYPQFTQHPPLTFIIESIYFWIFGISWTSIRLFSASIALLIFSSTLYFIYKNINRSLAYFTGALLAIIPPFFKKARFPNLDYPLALFVLLGVLSYFHAYQRTKESKKSLIPWLMTGLFFGLAFLSKGPGAAIIPITILLHLIFEGQVKLLTSYKPWLGLFFGILVISLWPMALYLHVGHFDVFINYFKYSVWGTVFEGRTGMNSGILTYPLFLLEDTGPIFVLTIVGLFFWKKLKEDERITHHSAAMLFYAFFLAVMVPMSFARWKYSHYIIPIYPAMAFLAAVPLYFARSSFHRYFSYIYKKIVIVAALVLLIFPLTIRERRDAKLFKIIDTLSMLPTRPKEWIVVDDSYPYYNLANLLGLYGGRYGMAHTMSSDQIKLLIESKKQSKFSGKVLLLKNHVADRLKKQIGGNFHKSLHNFMVIDDLTVMTSNDFVHHYRHEGQVLFQSTTKRKKL